LVGEMKIEPNFFGFFDSTDHNITKNSLGLTHAKTK